MKKAWVIIVIIFIAVAAIVGWFEYRNRQRGALLPAPTPSPQVVEPLPNARNFPPIPEGASFVYSGQAKAIPESLMTYRTGAGASTSELLTLAARSAEKLGLTASPSAVTIKENFVFVLNQGPVALNLTGGPSGVALSYRRSLAPGTPPSSVSPAIIADEFIKSLNLFSATYALSPLGQQPFRAEDIVVADIPAPELYEYGFGLSINNIPFLSPEYALQWGVVVVDERGLVRLAKISLPRPSLTPAEVVPLVSLESALSNLAAGRGALVHITSRTQESYFDARPAFSRGDASDFSIVYVEAGGTVVPAYRFLGTGQTREGKTQSFEAVVLASSSQL